MRARACLDFGTKVVRKRQRSATGLRPYFSPHPKGRDRFCGLPLRKLGFRTYRFVGLVWVVRLAPIYGAIFFLVCREIDRAIHTALRR